MLDPAILVPTGDLAYALLFLLVAADGVPVAGAVVPGYLLLVGAGAAVRVGDLSLPLVAALAVAGALLGDCVAYGAGRRYGARLLARAPRRVASAAARLRDAIPRRLGPTLVLGRFHGVTRALASPLAGAAGVAFRRFLPWSAVASVAWVAKALAIGWCFGGAAGGGYAGLALAVVALAVLAIPVLSRGPPASPG